MHPWIAERQSLWGLRVGDSAAQLNICVMSPQAVEALLVIQVTPLDTKLAQKAGVTIQLLWRVGGSRGRPSKTLLRASITEMPCFLTVEM